jgi:hypothetical protein
MLIKTSDNTQARPQDGTVLPVCAASMQTRHILQAGRRSVGQTQRVLTAFALVLAFAVVCTMLLIVSTGTAYALTATARTGTQTGLFAVAAFTLATAILIFVAAARRPARTRHSKAADHSER